ncbi:hypothetical protein UM91_14280 [Pseudomonas oryzihabitans]|nr:hypothetical protein UM91_14280 [Pseudomonas oryzihabitans]
MIDGCIKLRICQCLQVIQLVQFFEKYAFEVAVLQSFIVAHYYRQAICAHSGLQPTFLSQSYPVRRYL